MKSIEFIPPKKSKQRLSQANASPLTVTNVQQSLPLTANEVAAKKKEQTKSK